MVDGGVDGKDSVIAGLRDDFSVMLIVFVAVVARSAPGCGIEDTS